jgi:hypothetical protein
MCSLRDISADIPAKTVRLLEAGKEQRMSVKVPLKNHNISQATKIVLVLIIELFKNILVSFTYSCLLLCLSG